MIFYRGMYFILYSIELTILIRLNAKNTMHRSWNIGKQCWKLYHIYRLSLLLGASLEIWVLQNLCKKFEGDRQGRILFDSLLKGTPNQLVNCLCLVLTDLQRNSDQDFKTKQKYYSCTMLCFSVRYSLRRLEGDKREGYL